MNDNYTFTEVVIMVIMCLVLAVGTFFFKTYQCGAIAHKQGLESSWGPIQGCMVKGSDGKWIDYNRLRLVQ